MAVTAEQVKQLREKTGVGMMDCKNALSQTEGDFEKAVQILREKGLSAAAKKSDRSTNEGRVFTSINSDHTQAVVLEVNCETDFVAGNDQFIQFGQSVVDALANSQITTVDQMTGLTVGGKTLAQLLPEVVLKLGENITFKQFKKIQSAGISEYVHMNGKIGVLVAFTQPVSEEVGKGVAMHVAAVNPLYLRSDQIPTAELEAERAFIKSQVLKEGKPENIVDKIVEGKLTRFFKENCLLEQDFVKNPDVVIKSYIPQGSTITEIVRFAI